MRGRLSVVGIGPGDETLLTPMARRTLEEATAVVGYRGYLEMVSPLLGGKNALPFELGQEVERAWRALDLASQGERVALLSSGDPGIYGMASPALEAWLALPAPQRPPLEVVPGVPALAACAALLGAPLGHDFAVVSLSDLLTPWEVIVRRLEAAAAADFVLVIYNPRSRGRPWQLGEARRIVLRHRSPDTPVGLVRRAYRQGQAALIATLGTLDEAAVDMETTIIVGSSRTLARDGVMLTPRGYRQEGKG
ncbi:MAG TPA: precorrin-3B C(17)-methyltransferase [Dehalococcoidia bacterium]|nr:precorrin-3B C(17)-methyltransferase [Dehalococcoidia bacterium]